ncbi:protein LDOC1L-like isoform X2 [Sinocyclocheilus anshuiensis]|uniref:protein LDOC1L-like isoform X2 n=1 Tax=Sinocyclocheilus anshuiensis TaxID=1608454 RepID=UPI0007BA840B|nr:PREDICTED: protein LDOC1L-like isoform X2 [Sinocyclocheilus anshuiensis]
MSAPDPFQEIVDALKQILTPAIVTPPVMPVTNAASSTTVLTGPMARPAPFSGSAEECNGFLLQCSLALEMQPPLYATESAKIAFIISLLTGRALQWAETIWSQAVISSPSRVSVHK